MDLKMFSAFSFTLVLDDADDCELVFIGRLDPENDALKIVEPIAQLS